MAILVSTIFSSMRGSIAGTTFLTTPSGQIIGRQRTKPCNPNTTYQNQIRNALASAVANWESMGASNRELWDSYALTLGSGKSGRSVFIGNYSLAVYASSREPGVITPGTTPPIDPGVFPIQQVQVAQFVGPGTGFAVSFTNNTSEDAVCVAELSPAQSTARNFYSGPWNTSGLDLIEVGNMSSVIHEFTGLQEGAVYFARLRFITAQDPLRTSSKYILRAIAETVGP